MKTLAIKKFQTIEQACELLGFDVELPKRFKVKEIRVLSGRILEIELSSVTVRKVKYSNHYEDDIAYSSYKGTYPNDCNGIPFSHFDGQKGVEYWNGSAKKPKAYLSIWTSEFSSKKKYAYSVYAPKGIMIKTMAKWESIFK